MKTKCATECSHANLIRTSEMHKSLLLSLFTPHRRAALLLFSFCFVLFFSLSDLPHDFIKAKKINSLHLTDFYEKLKLIRHKQSMMGSSSNLCTSECGNQDVAVCLIASAQIEKGERVHCCLTAPTKRA